MKVATIFPVTVCIVIVCLLLLVSCFAPTTQNQPASVQTVSRPLAAERMAVPGKSNHKDKFDNYTDWAIYREIKRQANMLNWHKYMRQCA
jgi:hypothetical protein